MQVFKKNKKLVKKQMLVKDLVTIIDCFKDLEINDEEFILETNKILKSTLHKVTAAQLTVIIQAVKYMDKFESCRGVF